MVIIVMSKQIRAKKGSSKSFKAIEGQQLTEDQIGLFIEFFNKHNTIPGNKIVCTTTGKLTTCVGPWKDKKIKEYRGVENLLRNYKRREANAKSNIIKLPVVETYNIPSINSFVKPGPYNPAEESKSVCLRPDIFLDNGRHCEGCFYYSICLSRLKNLPSYLKKAA